MRKFVLLVILVVLFLSSTSYAVEYQNTINPDTLELVDMDTIPIRFVGTLNRDTGGKSCTSNFEAVFKAGEIPVYGFDGDYAYLPYGKDIYKIREVNFVDIYPVGDDYEVLGVYKTYNPTFNGRLTNILRTSELISGISINPGEIFNFNEYAGPYTEENGYEIANISDDGLLYEGYGGGASQVSSTLYAVIINNTNIDVLQKEEINPSASYIPENMNASVYNGKKLVFRNNYPFTIIIEVEAEKYSCIVKIKRAP